MAGFVDKFKSMWDSPEEEYDEYEYEDDDYGDDYTSKSSKERDVKESNRDMRDYNASASYYREGSSSQNKNKVVNINATAKIQVVLFKPNSFGEETRTIADELMKTHTVVLNLENTDRDVSRRIIDFLSGCAYANRGKIKRIATSTFIIIPNNVDLTGDDLLDELENSGLYF